MPMDQLLVLVVEKVSKVYRVNGGLLHALRGVSLTVNDGEICALIGDSGSGKTTLMNLIGLLDRPTSGEIHIAGFPTSQLTPDKAAEFRKNMIGFVFQSFHLLPRLTALDNVALPLIYRGLAKATRRELAEEALARVGLARYRMHRPRELSGGQCQRVAIARATIGSPRILLADEPTGSLDSRARDNIMALFAYLNTECGLTILVITHDPVVAAACKRRINVCDGYVFEKIT